MMLKKSWFCMHKKQDNPIMLPWDYKNLPDIARIWKRVLSPSFYYVIAARVVHSSVLKTRWNRKRWSMTHKRRFSQQTATVRSDSRFQEPIYLRTSRGCVTMKGVCVWERVGQKRFRYAWNGLAVDRTKTALGVGMEDAILAVLNCQ